MLHDGAAARAIDPAQNQIVFFPSETTNEILLGALAVRLLPRPAVHGQRLAPPMSANGNHAALHECLLDEQPHYLVPPNTLADRADAPLIVNPDCWFRWHGPPRQTRRPA